MKNQYLILLLLPLAFCACKHTTENTKGTSIQEKVKIKRKVTADYQYKPGDKCVGGITLFNELGQIEEERDYSSCAVIFKKVYYTYNEEGQITTSTIESAFENVTYQWLYNKKGQVVKKIATKPTRTFQYQLIYNYDSLGNQIEYIGTMKDGSAFGGTSRKTFEYINNKKIKTTCFSGENFDILGYQIKHIYDKEGKEIQNFVFKNPESEVSDTIYISYEYY